jgi:hypothetical protein
MKQTLIAAILFGLLGSSAVLASDDEYCNVPVADWQPREALQKKLEDDGWKVRRIKSDDGCYEVYAIDDKGRRIEAAYDPKTFEMMKLERSDD